MFVHYQRGPCMQFSAAQCRAIDHSSEVGYSQFLLKPWLGGLLEMMSRPPT